MLRNFMKPNSAYELLCEPTQKLYRSFSKKDKLQDTEIMTLLKPKVYSDTFLGIKRLLGVGKQFYDILDQWFSTSLILWPLCCGNPQL